MPGDLRHASLYGGGLRLARTDARCALPPCLWALRLRLLAERTRQRLPLCNARSLARRAPSICVDATAARDHTTSQDALQIEQQGFIIGGSIAALKIGVGRHPPLQASGAIAGPAPPCASLRATWNLSCSSVRTARFSR